MTSRFVPGSVAPATPSADPWWFVVGAQGVWMRVEDRAARPPRAADLAAAGLPPADAHYLGRLDGEDVFAVAAPDRAPPPGIAEKALRSLYGKLDELGFTVAGRAVQVVEWDRTHRHCGRCGAATTLAAEERARVCPSCRLRAFPRLAPAVIVLVERGERILLARAANFPLPFYSTLAGFVEPGESLEECIAREIKEEVGVDVANPRYFGSQPWPFPHSLMVGFRAEWAGGEIVIDQKEIADAGWYGVDDLPPLPSGISIARRLIDDWLARRGR